MRVECGHGVENASVNGINLAYRVQGEGPPLVLIMAS